MNNEHFFGENNTIFCLNKYILMYRFKLNEVKSFYILILELRDFIFSNDGISDSLF